MKTKFLRIGKSSLSLTLSFMMIVTTVFFGSFGTADAITKSDTVSVDVVEDAVADINVDVEEADDAFADTTEIDKTVSAYNTTAEDTAAADKSVTVDSSSVSTSVTTTNTTTKKTEKKTPEVSGAESTVVYFARPGSWNLGNSYSIYVYAYDSSDNATNGAWPGKKMTLDSEMGLYKTSVSDSASGLVFSYGDGGSNVEAQVPVKGGFTASSGHVYTYTGDAAEGGYNTIYFKKPSAWNGKIYAHYYSNTYGQSTTEWRGTEMSVATGETDVYVITLGKYFNRVIFNTNRSTSTVTQSPELKPNDGNGKVYKKLYDDINTNSQSWDTYTPSTSAPFYFLYGTDRDPATFTTLTVNSDSNGYYVELPTVYGINYYFGISSSSSYSNFYTQGNVGDVTVTKDDNVTVENKAGYNRDNTTFYSTRVSTNSASVNSVKIYINYVNNTYGFNYTIESNTNSNVETGSTVTLLAKTGTIRDATVNEETLALNRSYDRFSKLAEINSLDYTDSTEHINYNFSEKYKVTHTGTGSADDKLKGSYRLAVATDVKRNKEIEYKVQIKDGFRDKYYVKAFNVNGETYNVIDQSQADTTNGIYSCQFTIDDDDEGPIEITPIYYYIVAAGEEDNYITFSVEDFAGNVKKLWGGTVACYAYYINGNDITHPTSNSTAQNALGGYPGQPMVYINGSYYMQIPKYLNGDTSKVIEGITLNNYAWDEMHMRKILGKTWDYSISDYDVVRDINCQTYDYDDFTALRETRSADRIIFSFKYRTYNGNDNKTDSPYIGNTPDRTTNDLSYVTTNGNGWDALVDYYDVPVDLFARRIANTSTRSTNSQYLNSNDKYLNESYVESDECTDKVYVVSDGYVAYYSHADNSGSGTGSTSNKYVGQYATRWYVYTKSGSTYTYVGALPPSAFLTGLTKNGDSANAKTYAEDNSAYTEDNFLNYGSASTAAENNTLSTWDDYKAIYQACAGLPVVITYESNIYADGVDSGTGTNTYCSAYDVSNYYGTSQNPGYRCDGRWYYSKANQIIKGTTKIKIIKKDSDGNIVTDSEGNIEYQDDPYNGNSNVGGTTGASAYFTNKTTDAYGNSYYGLTSTSVYEDEEDDFTVKASANSSGSYTFDGDSSASDVIFKFVGWYLETGSGLLNPISTDVTGSRQMDSSANFIAVYEPVKVTARSLFIEHELYADLYDSLSSKTGVTAPKNGTGTPYIDSVVITNNGETLYSNKTKVNGSVIVINDSTALVDGATVTVTLSATPANSETTYEGVYIPGTTSGYVENSVTGTKASGVTLPNGTTTTYTYTYTISDELFTDNKATLSHYSDFSTTLLSINFKYYDRVTSPDSHTETISTTASNVIVSASAEADDNSKSIANAITKALGEATKNESSPMSTLKNVIDNYYFWTSTNEATEGIKDFINYHVVDKDATNTTDITERYHTTYAKDYGAAKDENDKAILSYHLDCYGVPYKGLIDAENPSNADGYSAEAWVTYTKTNGTSVTYTSQSAFASSGDTLSNVKSVTVWGYNAPRTYQVEVYKPGTSGDLTQDGNVYYTNTSGGSVSHEVITAFYNQRLAGKDENYDGSDGSNSPSDYLKQYGITTGYFGDDSAVTADEEITFADGETKVVFDGWYDANTHTKISSDRTYGYRVTTNLSLVAGYKSSKTSDTTKVSVIKNGVEPFIDANNQSRVRLTTVVNVYDNLDNDPSSENYLNPKDKDENIKKVSAIYVQLPVKDSDGNKITWNSANLAALNLDSTTEGIGKAVRDYLVSSDFTSNTEVKNSDTLSITIDVSSVTFGVETTSTENQVDYGEVTGKIISYTYDVTFNSTDIDANTTMLTNKNRVQFTLPMKAELYYGTEDSNGTKVAGSNSAIIAYAAIYYDTTDDDNENGSWIVSENHAEFIAPVVAGNSTT